jgi:hypothetical protein
LNSVKAAGKKRTLVPPESFRKYFWDSDWEDLTGHADRYASGSMDAAYNRAFMRVLVRMTVESANSVKG